MLGRCNSEQAPWYVIPSDHKWVRNLTISPIVVGTLEDLGMQFPEPGVHIEGIKQKYHATVAQSRGNETP
jgi:hypothetical protein